MGVRTALLLAEHGLGARELRSLGDWKPHEVRLVCNNPTATPGCHVCNVQKPVWSHGEHQAPARRFAAQPASCTSGCFRQEGDWQPTFARLLSAVRLPFASRATGSHGDCSTAVAALYAIALSALTLSSTVCVRIHVFFQLYPV